MENLGAGLAPSQVAQLQVKEKVGIRGTTTSGTGAGTYLWGRLHWKNQEIGAVVVASGNG